MWLAMQTLVPRRICLLLVPRFHVRLSSTLLKYSFYWVILSQIFLIQRLEDTVLHWVLKWLQYVSLRIFDNILVLIILRILIWNLISNSTILRINLNNIYNIFFFILLLISCIRDVLTWVLWTFFWSILIHVCIVLTLVSILEDARWLLLLFENCSLLLDYFVNDDGLLPCNFIFKISTNIFR